VLLDKEKKRDENPASLYLFHDKTHNFGGIMPKFLGFDLNSIDFFEKWYTLCMEAENQRLGFGRFP
jgi:hypothetical protein